jgi:hypothetical protein
MQQMIDAYEEHGHSLIGVENIPRENTARTGSSRSTRWTARLGTDQPDRREAEARRRAVDARRRRALSAVGQHLPHCAS